MANIMVVDDERDVVTLMRFLLERDGHTVSEAYNGIDALKKLGVEPRDESRPLPDLIIIDVMMPLLDGWSVTAKLAELPRMKGVKLIVLTAKGETRDLFAMAPNVSAYVDKPFDPKKLRELIRGILQADRG